MGSPIRPPLAVREVELAGGHRLDIEPTESGSVLRIAAPDGRVSLSITVTPDGPVIQLGGHGAVLRIDGPLGIEADRVALHGRAGVALSSGGDVTVEAVGDIRTTGRSQEIVAGLGDVRVKANDDVRINGERVKLNC
jgi:hypothetical protein